MLGLRDELDADPNQPLFILDGFESTLAAINDLDINRVASITILKDAASTAIYGSKAANGVIRGGNGETGGREIAGKLYRKHESLDADLSEL